MGYLSTMRITTSIYFSALCLLPVHYAAAADLAAGRAKSMQCVVCHGQNGISTMVEAPNLAGHSAIYIQEQLRNYRSGKRTHEVMTLMAKPLTDQDIEDLSAWYSAFHVEVTAPK